MKGLSLVPRTRKKIDFESELQILVEREERLKKALTKVAREKSDLLNRKKEAEYALLCEAFRASGRSIDEVIFLLNGNSSEMRTMEDVPVLDMAVMVGTSVAVNAGV